MKACSRSLFIYLFVGLLIGTACSQSEPEVPDPEHRRSPIAIANILDQPSDTYIKIIYGQPYKRGRQIFGDLVPYNQVWRTGANEATEITTTRDILFAGERVSAGTYALFTIPRESDNWTIILNDRLGQWGAFDYDESGDVLRVDAPSHTKDRLTEAFTIQFSEVENDSTNIVMEWDQTVVKVPVEFIASSNMQS